MTYSRDSTESQAPTPPSGPAPASAPPSLLTIIIEPFGWQFTSDGKIPLLEAARNAGFILPSSCRNGTCRTCLCQLRSGQIRYRIEWPGVSPEEKKEGWILPCVALAESSLTLMAPAARAAKTEADQQ